MSEEFWTMRQKCPLNPLLFNVLLADLKEDTGQDQMGWSRIDTGEKVLSHCLMQMSYDIVLLTEDEGG